MNAIVETKARTNNTVLMFEWDVARNRYVSDITYTAWQGYVMAVQHLTGETLK